MFVKGWNATLDKWLGLQLDSDNNLLVNPGRSGTQISTDQDLAFTAAGAGVAANTQKTITFTAPEVPAQEYAISVYNPSTITDLSVKAFAVEVDMDGTNDRDALISTFVVAKAQTVTGTALNAHLKLLHGAFMGADLKLVVSNDTVLTGGQEFTGVLRLREVSN